MHQKWQYWNKVSRKWLAVLVVLGILASIPIISDRIKTETSANNVEMVFDYRDLVDISVYQAHPQDYIQEQLARLKAAGVNTMALYESSLDELRKSRRIMIFNTQDLANKKNQLIPANTNYTYVVFTSSEYASALTPLIERTFHSVDIDVQPWSYNGQQGLVIQTPPENATIKPLWQDPITLKMLRDQGFNIMPRLGDSLPYNSEDVEQLLSYYEENGVKRILFEGDAVKGFNDNEDKNSLVDFAELLNRHGIGMAAIENLKKPQKGFSTVAYLTHYNVVRLYSLSDRDASLDVDTIADRFALATKDRKIRMLYLNVSPARNSAKAEITDQMDNLLDALGSEGHAVQMIEDNGFKLGQAEAFKVAESSYERYLKIVVTLGAVAFVALMISYFIPYLTIPAFVLGLLGFAALYKLNANLFEQGLALLVAISAPTVAVILAVRKVTASQAKEAAVPVGNRLVRSLVLYVITAVISLSAVPFMISLLNNITYSLVINQFRGVSLLHVAPIGLIAIYVFFYRGISIRKELPKLLRMPITVMMVIVVAVIGIVGMYYLSRTGNGGTVSPLEMSFRTAMENLFGVRPRNKEFLMAHPIFILGAFLAFKYRNAVFLFIIAVIGQLSMVDTFAHIHSPATLSFIRGVLGLGLGLIFGIIAVLVWQLGEGLWKRWMPRLKR
ncbi:DUF5693 family protein [Paenibacillus sp. JX-17]|uniref:DUF5693 family protein n=1 Tax=Paenibacillus lacisoli TaxID=3064525 RepID=A0ABT9CB99_9BACL|nr:DUF5693 family protein [Paenibacillus sp. JX-17]MDO7906539.1 DUF5693 family protein [Paenibacillus sp. JX-17]